MAASHGKRVIEGWIWNENVQPFVALLARYAGYDFDGTDRQAVGLGLEADDERPDRWYSYPLVGSGHQVGVHLAKSVGGGCEVLSVWQGFPMLSCGGGRTLSRRLLPPGAFREASVESQSSMRSKRAPSTPAAWSRRSAAWPLAWASLAVSVTRGERQGPPLGRVAGLEWSVGTILKGMHRIRWHELTHAYGSARDVPGRLSRVAWGDARTSADALSDLGLWLGELAVFDATVAAVPFLWDLAVTDSVNSRPEVIELLQAILEHGNPPKIDVQFAAHQAVLGGRRAAELLVSSEDPAVRQAAIALVAAIDGHVCEACRPA